MKSCTVFVIIITFCLSNSLSITLDGTWTGKIIPGNKEHDVTFSGIVPGGIYTDLSESKLIPENFVGNNDVTNRWIGNQSVTYTKTFDVNKRMLSAPKIMLVFYGIDTFATIVLNGHTIGETSNMFLKYTFDVTEYLKIGANSLDVSFSSPVKVAESLYNEQATKYIIPPICWPNNYNGECHVNHIRKMQASFAWDWGPAFPSMGIWKSVELIPVNNVSITDFTIDIDKKGNFWNIIITIFLNVVQQNKPMTCHVSSTLNIHGQMHVYNSSFSINANEEYTNNTVHHKVPVNLVQEWWPNGYGNQTLYPLSFTIAIGNNLVGKRTRVGFRTVELVQKPLKQGLSFYFRINGVPIFAKGSNFIPASVFPELSAKKDTIEHLLSSVKQANMNMLRVWGGGLYESELFYDIADEYGIMIWQDFMFACGMYPTAEKFLQSIKEEVVQNVIRLKSHPSVVLWAGNNENEAALYGNWYGTKSKKIYKTDYIKLYVELIKKEVEQLDVTRPFVVSSPSNGLHTEDYNYIGEDPLSKLYGDVHYYNYIANGWNMQQYPRARFSSEYGFQSLPSIYTLLPATKTREDLNIDSNFMKHRQHLTLGNFYLKELISKNFNITKTQDSQNDFKMLIYLSQINQAVSVKIQTEFYRQSMSELNEIGEGMTMGALYWQLNDVWQAPSWSSIDFYGRWKMLHYYAVEFFAPIIITYYIKNSNVAIYVVSEKLYPMSNITLEVNLYTWKEMVPIQACTYSNITIGPNAATKIDDNLLNDTCHFDSFNRNNGITTLTLKDNSGSLIAPRNYIYPRDAFKNILLPTANVSVKINDFNLPGRYLNYADLELELTTDTITYFVWLEAGNICGRFSENGFHLFEKKKVVIFHACEMITPQVLRKSLEVTTLADIYAHDKT